MNIKLKPVLVLLLFAVCHQTVSQAKAWDITEEMMQQMVAAIPSLEKNALEKMPCASKINASRRGKEKGLTFEFILKDNYCSEDFVSSYFFDKEILDKFKSSPQFDGLVHWLQRGFYFNYIFKSPDGEKLRELHIDREKLFWKPFSQLREPIEDFDNLLITVGNKALTFQAKGFEISKLLTPGHPIIQKYCGVEFNQERYLFTKDKVSFLFSVISLLPSQSDDEQLQCIRDGDFALQKKLYKNTKQKYQIKTVTQAKNTLLKPTYKVIESEKHGKTILSAFSNLIDQHIVAYIVFSAPSSNKNQQLIDDIIASFKLETR